MSAVASIAPLSAPETVGADWKLFPESSAQTWYELNHEFCAPPYFVAWPAGAHYGVQPQGATRPVDLHIDSTWATRLDRHLQAMRSTGKRPFFDFQHQAGELGYPLEFHWDPRRGVMALTEWTALGEGLILSGECNSFSPMWVHNGDDILGLRLNCGALVHRSNSPAFGRRMPPIKPILKRDAMLLRAKLFLQRVDARAHALRASGETELAAVRAFEFIKSKYHDLHEAYELREALRSEFCCDFELRHPD